MDKRTKIFSIALPLLLLCVGCDQQPHFIGDKAARRQVTHDFRVKQSLFPEGGLFEVFDQPLPAVEKEALAFLYAYMPIGDMTDYSGAFYLENIRSSFRAKAEMPWGDSIPEVIFRHFVLPVRVNNENLDDSRLVFYEELKDRVRELSLYDAVLEVNHWCHEKVIYTPSDGRTSSPLASVRTAYGRCGEESVFTVAALRSVGIPARQVYTPRWAHTDDNHAWVEAWVDGKWYFMGACEPEPVLNLGWFNEPAYRGMLMHTKVFGKYDGPEETMERTDCYTEINVIDNYAPTAKGRVRVVDTKGHPVKDAEVEFKLYNYAEFYTVARKMTDAEGEAFLSAGKGDMLVWATKGGAFGFSRISFGKEEQVTVTLDKRPGDEVSFPLDIVPPVAGSIAVEVTEAQQEENARRLLEEDVIRNEYVATFCSEETAKALADELGIDPAATVRYMTGSRGNWREIERLLRLAAPDNSDLAMALLGVISPKDLRDTPSSVLADHMQNTGRRSGALFEAYVLNPRVANELLTPYRSLLRAEAADLSATAKNNPQAIVEWVKAHIAVKERLNPQRIPVMPLGVWRARVADAHSRNIFFVALMRSFGVPSRIERVTGKVQYLAGEKWVDVDFESAESVVAEQGSVTVDYQAIKTLADPVYYSHFTVAKILPSGKLQTLDFESGIADMGGGNTWSQLFKQPLPMDEGDYLLITGNRMAKGHVLANVASFRVERGKTTHVGLVMRENQDDIQVIGTLGDVEARFRRADNGEETTILSTTGRGYFIIGILGPRQEPTNHAMRDIAAFTKAFEAWNRPLLLLFNDERDWTNFDAKEFGALPSTIVYGIDTAHSIRSMLASAMNLPDTNQLPLFVIADTFGRVVFTSKGYTIGLGEQMMQVIHKLTS
ncbi:MAG: transglutaminase-like domain-containing protein [Tannerellaceae bacterium]|jgi:transglutaminase-like putative cysteine protease|nr:transglutaminase-like domain-containing protein [Tannerellaceae bacterium]